MGRGPLHRRVAAFLPRKGPYAGLAHLSARYPPPMGMFPRVPQPCATVVRKRPCDLHALGTPPAFVLSQDQTLHINGVASACALRPPPVLPALIETMHDSVVKVLAARGDKNPGLLRSKSSWACHVHPGGDDRSAITLVRLLGTPATKVSVAAHKKRLYHTSCVLSRSIFCSQHLRTFYRTWYVLR